MNKTGLLILAGVSLSGALITGTPIIGIAIGIVATALYVIAERRATNKREWELFQVLPEIIDHVISGIQSGLSLNESLMNLGVRGPTISQPLFQKYRDQMISGESFENSMLILQNDFSLRAADQLFEALIFAKSLGGSELHSLLRQLGDFIRQDLSLRREILAKQQWIRNSAHLSAGAPWILLLLLSAQPATADAFATPQGALILLAGMILTFLA